MAKALQACGARQGASSSGLNLIARIAAQNVSIFCIPGTDTLIRMGFNPSQRQTSIAATPSSANVLLVAGPLPEPLAQAAAVAYAQMPRPRLLAQVGDAPVNPLPEPDLSIRPGEFKGLRDSLSALLARAWKRDTSPFEPAFLKNAYEENEENEDESDEDHSEDEGEREHSEGSDDSEDEEDHDMGGFMSMVMMTQEMPRSADGLAMNRCSGHFGPYFPGLPAGVHVTFQLDGDSVVSAEWAGGKPQESLDVTTLIEPVQLLERLAPGNSSSPNALRALILAALSQACGAATNEIWWLDAIPLLEVERARSHLAWLYVFAETVGSDALRREAETSLVKLEADSLTTNDVDSAFRTARRQLFLMRRLTGLAPAPENALKRLLGPLARSCGRADDERAKNPAYQRLQFRPVTLLQNDAWGRLQIRLQEVKQSLLLVKSAREAGSKGQIDSHFLAGGRLGQATAQCLASIETARGAARLQLGLREGATTTVKITAPSASAIELVPDLPKDLELSDALTAIASLDIGVFEAPLHFEKKAKAQDNQDHHHHHHH